MTSRYIRQGASLGSVLVMLLGLGHPACSDPTSCKDVGYCPGDEPGGTAGSMAGAQAGGGGATGGVAGKGGVGGSTASGSGGGAGEVGGDAGAGGTGLVVPCGGECSGERPVCKQVTDTCVECLTGADCGEGGKTKCDTSSNECVECLVPTDCADASGSRCAGGECVECQQNEDCAHVAGKGVCDAGECVACTGTDYVSCGQDAGTALVCDSLKRSCTTKKQSSAGLCQPCVSDAQCKAGQLCALQRFGNDDAEVGYFCFWQKGAVAGGAPAQCSSARPYVSTMAEQTSIDGAPGDLCGLAVSTCVARNQFRSKDCGTNSAPDDSKCGFEPGVDSKCVQFDTNVFRCTTTCVSDDDCLPGVVCDGGASPPTCQL